MRRFLIGIISALAGLIGVAWVSYALVMLVIGGIMAFIFLNAVGIFAVGDFETLVAWGFALVVLLALGGILKSVLSAILQPWR